MINNEQHFLKSCFKVFEDLFTRRILPIIEQASVDNEDKGHCCNLFAIHYFNKDALTFESGFRHELPLREVTIQTDNGSYLEKQIVKKMLEYMDEIKIKFPMLEFVERYYFEYARTDHFLEFHRKDKII